jgi:hypothetical protein
MSIEQPLFKFNYDFFNKDAHFSMIDHERVKDKIKNKINLNHSYFVTEITPNDSNAPLVLFFYILANIILNNC